MVSEKVLKNQVESLKKKVDVLKEQLRLQELAQRERVINLERSYQEFMLKEYNLGFNKGDYIYVQYYKIDMRKAHYQLGFVVKETLMHIKIVVYDRKRNSAHKYLIHKTLIKGIKHYDGDESSIITYEDLMKLWEANKKKN